MQQSTSTTRARPTTSATSASARPDSFVSQWEKLTKDLMAMPNVPGKLMIDIMNEPDAYNIRVRIWSCVLFLGRERGGRESEKR